MQVWVSIFEEWVSIFDLQSWVSIFADDIASSDFVDHCQLPQSASSKGEMTESGFQPIGVAVSCFSIKPPAKRIKGYRGFAAPAFELRQVAFIVKKTLKGAQGVVINACYALFFFVLLCIDTLLCFCFCFCFCFSI